MFAAEEAVAAEAPPGSHVSLTVNGVRRTLTVDNRTSLLDLLRERLDLTGSKKGCNAGPAAPARSWSTDAGSTPV